MSAALIGHRTYCLGFQRVLVMAVSVGLTSCGAPIKPPAVTVVSYHCEAVAVKGFTVRNSKIVEIAFKESRPDHAVWYDCTKSFSDRTWFRRVGDAKP